LDAERIGDTAHDPAQDPSLKQEPTLRDNLDVFLRRWWLVAACVIIAGATALGFSIASPPTYRAQTSVVVDRGGSTLGLVPDITGISQQSFVDTLAEIVKSRAVLTRAVRLLGVAPFEQEEALGRLRGGLKVQRTRNTDLILIQAEGPTPEAAAVNTNAIGRAFIDWHLEARRSQARAGREFIEERLATLTGELRAAEDALTRFKVAGGQVSLSEQTTLVLEKLADFEAQRRAAEAERQGVEASLRRVRTELARQAPTVSSSFLQGEDPVATQLRADLAKLEVELVGLRKQFTDRHPQVIATKARIEEVKGRLRQQAAQTLLSRQITLNPLHQNLAAQVIKLEVDRQALQARESALAAAAGAYAEDLKTLPPKEVELARLTRDVKVAEETYLLLSQKLQEARIAEASIVGNLQIVDRAVPPATPVRPRPVRNTLFGTLLGFMVGVGAAYLLEALDTTFKTPEEAAHALGLPLLGAVPLWRVARDGRRKETAPLPLATSEHPRSAFAEAFRHLRTSLLYLSPDRPLRSVLVTSPGGGEGKGTVAANLAIALTQIGKKVWLLEADLRKTGLAWVFQPQGTFGLTDLLVDGLPAERAVCRTAVENLWFLPGGTVPPNPAELLGSQRMRAVLGQALEGADVVLVDAPPVLPVTDAAVLAPAVDGVILVIKLGRTPRAAARRARQQLEAVGARVVGVVANGVPMGRRGYGCYYPYYAGYYGDKEVSSGTPAGR
jgi:polysaccharide chain length determinant protein (PEP-CTERM system associated)